MEVFWGYRINLHSSQHPADGETVSDPRKRGLGTVHTRAWLPSVDSGFAGGRACSSACARETDAFVLGGGVRHTELSVAAAGQGSCCGQTGGGLVDSEGKAVPNLLLKSGICPTDSLMASGAPSHP